MVDFLVGELKASPLFDPNGVRVISNIMPDETTHYTFTVTLMLALKQPLKL
jgi:hypothetical protein